MNMDELTGALEAVLFASGDPVSAQQLVDILGIDIDKLDELVETLEKAKAALEKYF
jgi:segregation and condensation protein B